MNSGRKRDPIWEEFIEIPRSPTKKGYRAKCRSCDCELQGLVDRMKKHVRQCDKVKNRLRNDRNDEQEVAEDSLQSIARDNEVFTATIDWDTTDTIPSGSTRNSAMKRKSKSFKSKTGSGKTDHDDESNRGDSTSEYSSDEFSTSTDIKKEQEVLINDGYDDTFMETSDIFANIHQDMRSTFRQNTVEQKGKRRKKRVVNRTMKVEWTYDQFDKLVDLIKTVPLLWNSNHPLYRKRGITSKIWDEIIDRINLNSTDDPELIDLLNSWEMPEVLIKLKERNINFACLKLLKQRHIDQMFDKVEEFGLKLRFENRFDMWKESFVEIDSDPIPAMIPDHSLNLNNITVESVMEKISANENALPTLPDILNNTNGKMILNYYRANGKLSDTTRQLLVDTIASHYVTNHLALSVNLCDVISNQILNMFQTEIKEYYFAAQKNAPPKGKLFNKYQNLQRKLRLEGLLPNHKRAKLDKPDNMENIDIFDLEPEEKSEDTRLWLCNHSESPLPDIQYAWKSTVKCRKIDLMQNDDDDFNGILKRWPAYGYPIGHFLIDIDFDFIYPGRNFFLKWEQYSEKLFDILDLKVKDANSKEMLSNLKNLPTVTDDGNNTTLIWVLHSILLPTSRKVLKNKDGLATIIKYTIKDSRRSVLALVDTIEKMDELISERLEEKPDEIHHPLIVVIGTDLQHPREFYVFWNGIKFKMCSFLKALDVCFKIFMVFSIKYPSQSMVIWQFIQNFFYCIQTKYDRLLPPIKIVMHDLKN